MMPLKPRVHLVLFQRGWKRVSYGLYPGEGSWQLTQEFEGSLLSIPLEEIPLILCGGVPSGTSRFSMLYHPGFFAYVVRPYLSVRLELVV